MAITPDEINSIFGYRQHITAERVMQSLAASIERDPNPQAYCKGAELSEDRRGLSVTFPDGTHFLITIQEM